MREGRSRPDLEKKYAQITRERENSAGTGNGTTPQVYFDPVGRNPFPPAPPGEPGSKGPDRQDRYEDEHQDQYEDEYEEESDGEGEEEGKNNKRIKLGQFIENHKDSIARRVIESYPPLYQPSQPEQSAQLPPLIRRPIGAQEHALRGTVLSLMENRGTTVVGEMGTGKTFIGAAAAYIAGFKSVLVLCPPHLVRKWKREVEITVPGAKAVIVESITDMNSLRKIVHDGPLYTIMSRERAKLSYLWKPAIITRPILRKRQDEDEDDDELGLVQVLPERFIACPQCHKQVTDDDGVPISYKRLDTKHHVCQHCEGPLWEADHTKRKRFPLANYAKLRMKRFFDLLICDEVHEYKGQGTAQGIAGAVLAGVCRQSLVLTGTLMGGYSSTLFHLLYRFSPDIKTDFLHSDRSRWIDYYGFRQKNVRPGKGSDDQPYEHGRGSRRQGYKTTEKETPGLAPSALFHLIGNTVFLRLSDVTNKLPPYHEQIMTNDMSKVDDPVEGISQADAYDDLYQDLRQAMVNALQRGSQRLLGIYLQALLSYPDACVKGETVYDPETHQMIGHVPPLSEDVTYPKEQALIDLVKQEKAAGRRVLVYVTHTGTRDITGRMDKFLTQAGFRTAVLKSTTTSKTDQRENWIAQRVKEGLDVLVCNPRLVQTGLDLVDFPTICWFETDYSVYTMRQASRRSWRIGQTKPVNIIFMIYRNTIQSDALKLIAKKLQSSLAVEGELPEDGLAAYGDDGDDLIMTLARQIMNNEQDDADSVEAIFAKARDVEAEGDEYLVDSDWSLTANPVPDQPDGTNDSLADPVAAPAGVETRTAPEPTMKPAPKPKPTPAPAPKPEQEEPAETRQPDLFSWEQFLIEETPSTSRRKRKKPAPAGASLFSWAIESQESREV